MYPMYKNKRMSALDPTEYKVSACLIGKCPQCGSMTEDNADACYEDCVVDNTDCFTKYAYNTTGTSTRLTGSRIRTSKHLMGDVNESDFSEQSQRYLNGYTTPLCYVVLDTRMDTGKPRTQTEIADFLHVHSESQMVPYYVYILSHPKLVQAKQMLLLQYLDERVTGKMEFLINNHAISWLQERGMIKDGYRVSPGDGGIERADKLPMQTQDIRTKLIIVPCMNEVDDGISLENRAARFVSDTTQVDPTVTCTSNVQSSEALCTYDNKLYFPPVSEIKALHTDKRNVRTPCNSLSSAAFLRYIVQMVTDLSNTIQTKNPRVFVLTSHTNRLQQLFQTRLSFANGCVLKMAANRVTCVHEGRVTKKRSVRADFTHDLVDGLPANCTVYLVRHGEGVHNRIKTQSRLKILGIESAIRKRLHADIVIDSGLTKTGIRDAETAGEHIANDVQTKDKTDFVFMASFLQRAQQTTMTIYRQLARSFQIPASRGLEDIAATLDEISHTRCAGHESLCG